MTREEREKFEASYQQAMLYWKEKHYEEALEILIGIAEKHPKLPIAPAIIGAIYREMGDDRNAARYFEKAIKLSPKSELASRALFHTLYRLGYKHRAFAEISRFLAIAESNEYRRILNEINTDLLENPGNYLKITDKICPN